MNRALTLKWFAVLGLASLFYLLAPRDVSPQMPLYLGMTSAAVIIWTFDLLPAVAVAAALTFLYLLTNMAPPEVVLGPWTTVLIWTTFGAAIFGEAMEKTGLAKRVALRCMLLTGGTFTGMLIGFAIGGIILGLLLASGVIGFFSAVLSNEAFISWGWRIAFIMSAGLLFVGSYIRSSVHETKDFAEAKAKMPEVKYPLLDAFKRYPKMMVACMGARLIDGVAFNTFAVFSLSYLTQTRGLERSSALAVVMIASCPSSSPSGAMSPTVSARPACSASAPCCSASSVSRPSGCSITIPTTIFMSASLWPCRSVSCTPPCSGPCRAFSPTASTPPSAIPPFLSSISSRASSLRA